MGTGSGFGNLVPALSGMKIMLGKSHPCGPPSPHLENKRVDSPVMERRQCPLKPGEGDLEKPWSMV